MKKVKMFLLLITVGIIISFGVWNIWATQKAVKRKVVRFKVPTVTVLKGGKIHRRLLSPVRIEKRSAPKPLSTRVRAAMIKKLRKSMGISTKPGLHTNPTAQVLLTAGDSVSGKNHYSVIYGSHYPRGDEYLTIPFSIIGAIKTKGFLEFHFEPLKAGKVYLLDMAAAGNNPKWLVSINSWSKWDLVNAQNDHIFTAFVANGSRVVVRATPYMSKFAAFFSCQLTRVD